MRNYRFFYTLLVVYCIIGLTSCSDCNSIDRDFTLTITAQKANTAIPLPNRKFYLLLRLHSFDTRIDINAGTNTEGVTTQRIKYSVDCETTEELKLVGIDDSLYTPQSEVLINTRISNPSVSMWFLPR